MLDFLKPDLVKQFPSSSMDNPALLGQFAHTLAGQYREMFPPSGVLPSK